MAEPDRLPPREFVAAACAAGADRQLVTDQLAAAPGETRRAFDQARALLLVAAGGEPYDAALFGSMLRRIATLTSPGG